MDEAKASACYESVMEAASYFRTGLTDDLETRERRSAIAAFARRQADVRARRTADTRLQTLAAVTPGKAESRRVAGPGLPIHEVSSSDEELKLRNPTPTE
jgi:hypothetical protein